MTKAEIIKEIEKVEAELAKNLKETGETGLALASSYLDYAKNCLKERE